MQRDKGAIFPPSDCWFFPLMLGSVLESRSSRRRLAVTSRKLICSLNFELRLNGRRRVRDYATLAAMLPLLCLIKKTKQKKKHPIIARALIDASGARIHKTNADESLKRKLLRSCNPSVTTLCVCVCVFVLSICRPIWCQQH